MARTRGEIKILIRSHTGRSKEALENSLCDSALKLAIQKHPFKDAISTTSDFTLTEDEVSVDISSASPLGIVTARIVEADGSRNTRLIIKGKSWWDENVINPEDNTKGWPEFGLRVGSTIYFNGPLIDGLELRLRITTEQTFTDDDTVCPIAHLDLFVERYATSEVFLDIGNEERHLHYRRAALGIRYDESNEVGGALRDAINADLFEIAEDLSMEVRGEQPGVNLGLSVLNNNAWHSRYGETDVWF
jgi:hypothetical protein